MKCNVDTLGEGRGRRVAQCVSGIALVFLVLLFVFLDCVLLVLLLFSVVIILC